MGDRIGNGAFVNASGVASVPRTLDEIPLLQSEQVPASEAFTPDIIKAIESLIVVPAPTPRLWIRWNKENPLGVAHAWGDAWLSFDGVHKVRAKQLELKITAQVGNKGPAVGFCNDCDSVSTDLVVGAFYLSFGVMFAATAAYVAQDGTHYKYNLKVGA
jgi:hypothetical protein